MTSTRTLFFIVKTISTLFFLSICNATHAQTIWEGGTPGCEHDWNHARNWNTDRVPEIFDDVTIPDLSTKGKNYPIITRPIDEIAYLVLYSGAELTVKGNGVLIVDGQSTYNYGVYLQGKLYVDKNQLDILNAGLQKVFSSDQGKIVNPEYIVEAY